MKLAIQSISLKSLDKMGCLLGAVLACLPSLLCGMLAMGIVQLLRHWLEGWQQIRIELLGHEVVNFDLVHQLGLTEFLRWMQVIAGLSWLAVILIGLLLALLIGLILATIAILLGLLYNLLASATGGVVLNTAVVRVRPVQIAAPRSALARIRSTVVRRRDKPDGP